MPPSAQPHAPRALDLQKECVDRVIDPQQLQPLAGQRAVLDLGAGKARRVGRAAIERRLIRRRRACREPFSADLEIAGEQPLGCRRCCRRAAARTRSRKIAAPRCRRPAASCSGGAGRAPFGDIAEIGALGCATSSGALSASARNAAQDLQKGAGSPRRPYRRASRRAGRSAPAPGSGAGRRLAAADNRRQRAGDHRQREQDARAIQSGRRPRPSLGVLPDQPLAVATSTQFGSVDARIARKGPEIGLFDRVIRDRRRRCCRHARASH